MTPDPTGGERPEGEVWRVAEGDTGLCGAIVYLGTEVSPGLFTDDTEWFNVGGNYAQRVADALNTSQQRESELRALRAQQELREQQHQALLDFLESSQCGECYGTGRTDNHVTGEVECDSCNGTGHDSREAFARAEAAESALRAAQALEQALRDTLRKCAGVGSLTDAGGQDGQKR